MNQNQQQKETFLKLFKSQKLPQVLLLWGHNAASQIALARQIASFSHCSSQIACGSCQACLQIQKDLHRDVLCIDTKAEAIKLADVEPIKDHLSLLPASANTQGLPAFRVLLLKDVDLLTDQALNRILKTFEEPGRSHMIIMTSTRHKRIQQTLLSRCVQWKILSKNHKEASEPFDLQKTKCLKTLLFSKKEADILLQANSLSKQLKISGCELVRQSELLLNQHYKDLFASQHAQASLPSSANSQSRRRLLHRLTQSLCHKKTPLNMQLTGEALGFVLDSGF